MNSCYIPHLVIYELYTSKLLLSLGGLCGQCSDVTKSPVELPCLKVKKISYMKKSKCGWWRRRHTCYKLFYLLI